MNLRTLSFTVGQALVAYSQRELNPLDEQPVIYNHQHNAEWRLGLIVFAFWFDRYQLSYQAMARAEVIPTFFTREAYELCTAWLVEAKIIAKKERHKTRYLGPWNRARLVRYLRFDLIPLPYPEISVPPSLITPAQITHSTEHRARHRIPPLRALAN